MLLVAIVDVDVDVDDDVVVVVCYCCCLFLMRDLWVLAWLGCKMIWPPTST